MEKKVLAILNEINPNIGDDINRDIIEDGCIDSLEIVNVVMNIEDEFQIEIDPELVIPDNFNSVKNIVAMIRNIIGE